MGQLISKDGLLSDMQAAQVVIRLAVSESDNNLIGTEEKPKISFSEFLDFFKEKAEAAGLTVVQVDLPDAKPEDSAEQDAPVQTGTKMEFLYRDACNYKRWNSVILRGSITDEQKQEIFSSLEGGESFIPEMVGLDVIRMEGYAYDTDVDTPYCELGPDAFSPYGGDIPDDAMAVEDLVRKFKESAGHWDDWDGWDSFGW